MPEAGRHLRIVHVVDYLMPNMGYQEYLLPRWNARHGHEVSIVTSDRFYPVPDYRETWGRFLGPRLCGAGVQAQDDLTIYRLPSRWEWRARPWLVGLERTILSLAPDVIFGHGTGSPSAFRLGWLAARYRIPLLMDNHMTFVAQNRTRLGNIYYAGLRYFTRRVLESSAYRFLGVADECCDFLERAQGIAREKIECLPLGVDTDIFRPTDTARVSLREHHGIPQNAIVILQTGKMSPDKAPHWLAEAAAPIMSKNPNVWLVFLGSGAPAYVDQIRASLTAANVVDRLRIIPFVPADQLAGVFQMADICVYPGASSLSSLEAAACARPVIMTDLPAGRWRASLGVGLCYETGNVADLRQKLDDLVESPQEALAIEERARDAVIANFSYHAVAQRSEALMYAAIQATNQAPPARGRSEGRARKPGKVQ